MSKVNTIARLDPRIVYTGSAWSNIGTATQVPVAGGVGDPTNAANGRGQFGATSGLNGYPIAKGTGAGITPMVSGVDFTYDSRLDTTGGSNVNVYDTGTASNLASGKYFRIVEGASNIASSIYPKSPGTPSYGLQIVAKDLTTEVSPPATQCYVDPARGKFVLPRPIYWSKCESEANIVTGEIGTGVTGYGSTPSATYAKFGNGLYAHSAGNLQTQLYFTINNTILSTGTLSFWEFQDWSINAQHVVYLDYTSNTYIQFGSGGQTIFVSGVQVATWAGVGAGVFHMYIIWDKNKSLTGGKSIMVFRNGTEVSSTTTTLPTFTSNIQFWGYINNGWLGWDNIKIWDHVVTESSAFEYNSGTGRESALHYIYGSANNYAPAITGTNNGVCYDYIPLPTDPVKLSIGTQTSTSLENASNILNGSGSFGVPSNLSTSAFAQLVAGTHFQYDKRLDASTTEDATYGFGATAGGIIDTGASGALAANKYIRVVENTKNVKDATGLNLQVYAKQIVNPATLFPPATQCYVDPLNGRFVLPRPVYWSKCDLISPNNGAVLDKYSAYKSVWGGVEESIDSDPSRAKWDNGWFVNAWWNSGLNFYVLGDYTGWTKLTLSQWLTSWSYGYHPMGSENCKLYIYNVGSYVQLVVNSVSVGTWSFTPTSKMHCYMVLDTTGGMSGGVAVKLYINGTQVVNPAGGGWVGTISTPGRALFAYQSGSSGDHGYATSDNHKAWTELVGDPSNYSSWEYNSGTGRESALHYIYGATSGYEYTPKLVSPGGVGYYKAGSSGNYATMTF